MGQRILPKRAGTSQGIHQHDLLLALRMGRSAVWKTTPSDSEQVGDEPCGNPLALSGLITHGLDISRYGDIHAWKDHAWLITNPV